ncbi:MAG: hypothetical protein HZB80_01905 [Deltaproteobacteria bacterium]|nr:hypothetical protein [Deltaproteobacteria bacterium]
MTKPKILIEIDKGMLASVTSTCDAVIYIIDRDVRDNAERADDVDIYQSGRIVDEEEFIKIMGKAMKEARR